MRFEQLLILVDLAQTHSFNQTAERHHITQQCISYSVKQLEQDLGVRIFRRSKLGVDFTPEGECVLEFARKMVESYHDLMVKLQKEDALNVGNSRLPPKIRFNISSVLLAANMPEIMETFSRLYPFTRLIIREVVHNNVLPALAEGYCDVAVWSINKAYFEQNVRYYRSDVISYEIIKKDKPMAVVSSTSELAKKKVLSREDMIKTPKNVFGLLPLDYYGKATEIYALYEDKNPAIHRQMILDSNIICFMSEDTYRKYFRGNRFAAKSFDYPVQPLYHVLLRSKYTQHKVYDVLSDIIKLSFK